MEGAKKPEEYQNELERAQRELSILYEISNAMRTTLKLDEILYIILTGVTAHTGLGFNRAMLFLVNDKENIIEGKMGIGPDNGEDANHIWKHIEHHKMDMDDLISAYQKSSPQESTFNQEIKLLKIPLHDTRGGLLALTVLEGMPLHLTKESIVSYQSDTVIKLLKTDELAVVPLKAKDRVNGIIIADNFITKKPIDKNDMRMLIMLANQAGLAIDNSHLYEKTVVRAHSDSLTELWNHGYFRYLLQEELEKAKATRGRLSLIMIDIDDFKIYNDTLGHQAGDKILKELAGLLKSHSRKMDFVCRYGGEEFAIIVPESQRNEVYLIAERLRQDIEKHSFLHEEILPNKKLTVSIGLASFPDNASSAAELIFLSDQALYQAKDQGKNKTCCYIS
ncbi:MAG: sensor domain-containing diguanylate cyclase [Candidatus Omnitrophota bacterium]